MLEIPIYEGSRSLIVLIAPPTGLQELDHGQTIPPGHGVLRVLTENEGDKLFVWNPLSLPEINEAHKFFKQCVNQGLLPYKVGVGGKATAEVMTEFNPGAGEIIFLPIKRVVGG